MVLNLFSLAKLKINSYADRGRSLFWLRGSFEAMFNPESYSFSYENVYQCTQGINTSGRETRYASSKPRSLALTFILDDTSATGGLLAGTSLFFRDTISDRIEKFLYLTTAMDGDIHGPRFLRIEWGDLIFDCQLQNVTVKYTLFNRSGQPIRAELDTVFIEDLEDSKRLKLENKSSPDLTHLKTVKAGDKLPLMANEVYNDPSYYIQLATANKLNNFRRLKMGTTLNLPPVGKGG